MNNAVIQFIGEFSDKGKKEQVIDCFMNGCCYWFAHILVYRFYAFGRKKLDPTVIMYAPKENHFGARIEGRVYDITGDVTDKYEWTSWTVYREKEPRQAELIDQGCIRKEPHIFEEDDA